MKNSILMFLLGVMVTISIAAGTNSFTVFKPATPVSTISFTTKYQTVSSKVNEYAKKGYVVKFMSGITDRYEGQNFITVVMEKY